MRATLEELTPVFTPQLFSISFFPSLFPSSPFFFPSSCIGKKSSFDMTFDINSRPLAKNHIREEIDLSFMGH